MAANCLKEGRLNSAGWESWREGELLDSVMAMWGQIGAALSPSGRMMGMQWASICSDKITAVCLGEEQHVDTTWPKSIVQQINECNNNTSPVRPKHKHKHTFLILIWNLYDSCSFAQSLYFGYTWILLPQHEGLSYLAYSVMDDTRLTHLTSCTTGLNGICFDSIKQLTGFITQKPLPANINSCLKVKPNLHNQRMFAYSMAWVICALNRR